MAANGAFTCHLPYMCPAGLRFYGEERPARHSITLVTKSPCQRHQILFLSDYDTDLCEIDRFFPNVD